jgi:hypothetical protein
MFDINPNNAGFMVIGSGPRIEDQFMDGDQVVLHESGIRLEVDRVSQKSDRQFTGVVRVDGNQLGAPPSTSVREGEMVVFERRHIFTCMHP